MGRKASMLSKEEVDDLCKIMSIGNTALKQCAGMIGLRFREFRGKLFTGKLDTSKLSPEQLEQLNAAKPLIFAVKEKCEAKILYGFQRMIMQHAHLAARNNYDPHAATEEFRQEGNFAVLDAVYGYTNTNIKLSTYVHKCIRNRIRVAINRLNPLCPLTNEALELVRRIQELQNGNPELTEEQAVEMLGLSPEERDVFFSSITKVVNENNNSDVSEQEMHNDDYTANRRGVDNDFKETFVVSKDARQAVKDAALDTFELACLLGDTFPYHGWKEDVASRHINQKTGERYTRQNVQYTLERAKTKVRQAFLHPPKVHLENPLVDKFFDEWKPENAVAEDQRRK